MGTPSRTNPERTPVLRAAFAVLVVLLLVPGCGLAQSGAAAVVLQMPSAVAYDGQGNLFVAERGGHVVRRLTTDGTVTVVAGTGTEGFAGDGGAATSAELDSPEGLAVDSAGNVYIADTRNHRVREVVAGTGLIATVAGTGKAGFSGDGAAASGAQLHTPTALAVDAAGDLYIADTRNHRVRRVAAGSGTISTVAGTGTQGLGGDNGPAVAAQLDTPGGLAVDAAGNVYVSDTRNDRIRRIAAGTGVITTVGGATGAPGLPAFAGDGGAATAASLALPRGLAVDAAGNVYVADSANQRVRRIAADGTITTVAGQGTESFAGDGGAAAAASMDAPMAVALSPSSQVTLADTADARVRQVATSVIRTILGSGATAGLATTTLVLANPGSVTYGSGTLTATLAGGSGATGSVTFSDAGSGTAVVAGTSGVSGGSASLDLSGLNAGAHAFTASYSGDGSYAAAQSQAVSFAVSPLAVSAAAQAVTKLYGLPVAGIPGTLTGVLARDAGAVSAVFATAAGTLSPVGSYPVTAVLTGSAAGNYTLGSASGTVTITPAPVTVSVGASTSSAIAGSPVTLTVGVVSTTSGVPTGTVTLFDGGASVGQISLVSGSGVYTSSGLTAGTHTFTASYAGDGNFLGGSAAPLLVAVGSGPDFTLAASGSASQSVASGSTASFGFTVNSPAALASPITLAVSGLPTGATASLNPAYIPPGGAVTAFTLTILTTKTLASAGPERDRRPGGGALVSGALLPLLMLGGAGARSRRLRSEFPRIFLASRVFFAVLACITSATLATGCANRVNTSGEAQAGSTYTLTVTGTATSASGTVLEHSVNVLLQVL